MTYNILASVLLMTLTLAAYAQSSFDRAILPLVNEVERSHIRGDEPQLRSAIAKLEALLATPLEVRQDNLARYTLAYARWRLVVLPGVSENERDTQLETAASDLTKVLKADPKFAEAGGLLGAVYGLQIGTSMWRGMTLGPKAGSMIDEAKQLAPNNPRILLQEGVSAFHTPGIFGGGVDKAEALIRRAQALFEQEPAAKPWPNWGRLDAHAWLGQVLLKKGDKAGARVQYDKALALEPEFGWVRYVLIPQLGGK